MRLSKRMKISLEQALQTGQNLDHNNLAEQKRNIVENLEYIKRQLHRIFPDALPAKEKIECDACCGSGLISYGRSEPVECLECKGKGEVDI